MVRLSATLESVDWSLSGSVGRIWNTYKDEFARTRKRELSIIE